jgi:hypothetical protein
LTILESRAGRHCPHTSCLKANSLISLMARGALFLKATPWTYIIHAESVFRPMHALQ